MELRLDQNVPEFLKEIVCRNEDLGHRALNAVIVMKIDNFFKFILYQYQTRINVKIGLNIGWRENKECLQESTEVITKYLKVKSDSMHYGE